MAEAGPELMYNLLRKFINVVDELRDCGLQKYIHLPRIAVLGSQSAGKSSVLESIVGLDFLPRGDGVVTRRPLELRLNHIDEGQKPYGVFPDEIPGRKFTNWSEVRDNIVGLTDKLCGAEKNIVDKPIVLQVYSHTCPDLTLVDLPGITRIAIGDQPKDIERITRNMAERYCKDPRTIILTVVPANADMTNSDGLQMAQQLDKKGIRTVGVITKIDIMDRGTNAKKMIMNQEVKLRLGYVGVKNRAQEDIINQIPVDQALAKEQAYFASHPVYSSMPPERLGCFELTKQLSKILFIHIKHSMPEIVKEIKEKRAEAQAEIADLGPPMPSGAGDKQHLLWTMITEFVQTFKNQIGGKYDARARQKAGVSKGPQRMELSGGARIKMGFYKLYADLDAMKATQEYSDMVIERAIAMHEGDAIGGFTSVDVFYYLLQPQLEKLREPAIDCLNDCYAQLEQLAAQIIDRVFMRFPSLRPVVMDIIVQILQELRDHTRTLVEAIIDSELNYHFTNNHDFKDINQGNEPRSQQQQPQEDPSRPPTGVPPGQQPPRQPPAQQAPPQSGNPIVRDLRRRIDHYFALVLRNARDTIPKQIGFFLVRKSQDALQTDLYMRINRNQSIIEALGEPRQITERRQTLQSLVDTLDNSIKVLTRDPDIANSQHDDSALADDIRADQVARKQNAAQNPQGQNPQGQNPQQQNQQQNQQNQQQNQQRQQNMTPQQMQQMQNQQRQQNPQQQNPQPQQQRPQAGANPLQQPAATGNLFPKK